MLWVAEVVAALVEGGAAVLDGLRLASVQAVEAHGAVAVPLRYALRGIDGDVVHGASCHARLAVGAAVGHGAEAAVADGKLEEQWAQHS